MSKYLVIVESPAKSKTIKKYLGPEFEVMASYGHVRDLVPKKGAVDPDKNFAMTYQIPEKSVKHIDAISKALKKCDSLYLATDPDREGEAISWHVYDILKEKKALENKSVHRVVFYQITKSAVKEAVSNPREISMDLVDAQQARRALDYLVGFNLSPLLWKKIRTGLSAGRVQSPALRLIVEREEEIEAFVAKEYWTIHAKTKTQDQPFSAKLVEYEGEKLKQFDINNEKDAKKAQEKLLKEANGILKVSKVEKKQRKRNPTAPFITSTLQQEASRKLGFSAQRTMRIAQQLYEGIEIDGAGTGLITYMRTDSVSLAEEALVEIRQYITDQYGKDDLPDEPRIFKTKTKNAQEAHEAIRPTSVERRPDEIKHALTQDQAKLYELIWKRTLASQMIHATIDTVAVDLACGEGNRFRANGSTIANPGFMKVYLEDVDDSKAKEGDEKFLPPMKEGDEVELLEIKPEQHFTEPPPRYSEASLVKSLEEHGIGRPSTYATIISTLQNRGYVILDQKRFTPTDVGRIVNKFLTKYFTQYVDYSFTANLEDELDAISRGEKGWIPLLQAFWIPFNKQVDIIDESVQRKDVVQEEIDEKCPECGKQLSIRLGRSGRFIGCTGFPDCKYTRNLNDDAKADAETVEGRKCPKCNSDLVVKTGPYGKFIGCSGYPNCRFIEPLEKPEDTGVSCPECNEGTLLKRKSRKGKIFYSCSTYPKCSYAIWNEPIEESCKKCSWPILTIKVTKRRGKEKMCPRKTCDFIEKVDE